MKTSDFFFDLPEELIAQTPLADRASSRLLVVGAERSPMPALLETAPGTVPRTVPRTVPGTAAGMPAGTSGEAGQVSAGGEFEHRRFRDITAYLRRGDCLVLNETKVIPARLIGRKPTGAVIEILLLKRVDLNRWEALVKPGRKARVGAVVHFGERLRAEVVGECEDGVRLVEFSYDGVFEAVLEELGQMPLPPYIHEVLCDKSRYNTVYAVESGSAAAPTAGLHFTPELLAQIEAMGVSIARLTLHVGLGTFRPVQAEDITDHHMHSEWYQVSEQAARTIEAARAGGGRIIAVGTTSARTLETVGASGHVVPGSGETDIFIYPGHRFQIVDALVTNFHLPGSTLMMLVSALAGRERILRAYEAAIRERYRFFSFGDAMLILGKESHEFSL